MYYFTERIKNLQLISVGMITRRTPGKKFLSFKKNFF